MKNAIKVWGVSFGVLVGVSLIFLLLMALWAPKAHAYATWSDGCVNCHGDFFSGTYSSLHDGTSWGTNLMTGHLGFMGNDTCSVCHQPPSGTPRTPVYIGLSAGITGYSPIACLGCHGRLEDAQGAGACVDGSPSTINTANCGMGAGLRQHHTNAGEADCTGCHGDAEPTAFTTAAESTMPPYYFTPDATHPNKPTNACNANPAPGNENKFGSTGLDNDGDGLYDGADPDCTVSQLKNADFDGDGKIDVAVYQPSNGDWFYIGSTAGFQSHENFGGPGLVPVPGDYDGDGTSDFAVYDTTTGNWFIDESTAGHQIQPSFGGSGYVPVPGDYDGDGKTDTAVYQTSNGTWCYMGSTAGLVCQASFGGPGYVPVPGDYDADGKTDPAVYEMSTGNWFIQRSTAGFLTQPSFGGTGYVPVPGDYDGDGKNDVAVYQISTGTWCSVGSTAGLVCQAAFGGTAYDPVAADYDGDGQTDTAVYEVAPGNWFINESTAGFKIEPTFGGTGFDPVLPNVTVLKMMGLL